MNYLLSFLFCGFVCVIAQLIYEFTCSFVVLGALLDLFHIYDRLIKIFHAGAMLPITSFGHSLMHGAMAMTKEYGVFGLAMGMFDLTAAGIASAILFAFLVAIFFKPKS